MTQKCLFRTLMFTWRWECLIFSFFNLQSVYISHRTEQKSNEIPSMFALWESSMHKNPYFNYSSVLYSSKSFGGLFTEVDCRKQKGIPSSWYAIELPDPHMNVETLITKEQGGLIWRGLLFADSCYSLSNKVMTVNFNKFFLDII